MKVTTVGMLRRAIQTLPNSAPVFISEHGGDKTVERVTGAFHGKIGEGALFLYPGGFIHDWNSEFPVELVKELVEQDKTCSS